MSIDVAVYAKSEGPVSWEGILRALQRRKVPAEWHPNPSGKPHPGQHLGGLLRPEGGGGAEDTITVGWEPLSDVVRQEALDLPGAAPHAVALNAARRLFQVSMPDSAGPMTRDRLGHLIELLGGQSGGVAYDANDDRLYRTTEYREKAGRP